MSKHKKISKNKRISLYDKYNHRCAYCGCSLDFKDMQIDHVKSVYVNTDIHDYMTDDEMYDESNLLPSCRQCNFYKSTMDIETFRDRLTTTMMENLKKEFSYKLALKYDLISENIKPIIFYFEEINASDNVN